MIVGFVNVLFHFAGQRWGDLAAAGFAFYVPGISVEYRFEFDKLLTHGGEFIVGDGLLKSRVAVVYFGVACGCVEFLPGYGKLVDERELKTAEALYGGIASAFRERRSAATRNEDRGSTEQNISRNKRRIH